MIAISKIIVGYSPSLSGSVEISGSKNSALPVMAACIMAKTGVRLENVPNISDVRNMAKILADLGCSCTFENNIMEIDSTHINRTDTEYETSGRLRASFLVAGPLLAMYKRARISLPGGCSIGLRPVDLHIRGFEALGAEAVTGAGFVELTADKLTGSEIYLDFPSVGATQNIMMAACLANGITIIGNAAAEPEVADLGNFLNKCGAKISGAGTDTVKITGVGSLGGTSHRIIPDRIEAGTFMTAAAATHGCIMLRGVDCSHLKPVMAKLGEMGVEFAQDNDCLTVNAKNDLHAASVRTMPFPGFPTDMQSQFTALFCMSEGHSSVTETIFENRFMYAGELTRMNAHIKIDGRTALIDGVKRLTGTKVTACDLRGGAALIVAGLGADGITEIENAEYIYRGYDRIESKLKSIGANIYSV